MRHIPHGALHVAVKTVEKEAEENPAGALVGAGVGATAAGLGGAAAVSGALTAIGIAASPMPS